MSRWLRCLLLGLLISVSLAGVANGAIIRVKPGGNDSNNGSSWELAKLTVQAAINSAASGDEIWVAAGTYVERITLKEGLGLYGGFAGTETTRDQRDWDTYVSILDGNQGGSVVTVPTDVTAATCIDGFTIRNGQGDYGGGINCKGSAIIRNNVITNNLALFHNGGGIYCDGSPTISDNVITNNEAWNIGGGICCSYNSPQIARNTISYNMASVGGGIYCDGAVPSISDNWITFNNASNSGGGIRCYYSSPSISNNVISCNNAYGASAILISYCPSGAVTNNTVTGNSTSGAMPPCAVGYYESGGSFSNNLVAYNAGGISRDDYDKMPSLRNNCIYNPGGTDYSNITPGSGDILVNPKLVAAEYGRLHIQPDSPCRDAGYDAAVGTGWTDMDGEARIQGAHVDIGADESDGTTWSFAPTVIRVSPSGKDSNDGSAWDVSKKTVQAGINAAVAAGGEVWVAAGIYAERINMPNYCYLYGGFAGSENSRSQRDWRSNKSILDGQKGGTVVTIKSSHRNAVLDGFTIQNGLAHSGGGVDTRSGSPSILNNTITGNIASEGNGGGIESFGNLLISGNLIADNRAHSRGGGLQCSDYAYLSNNMIRGNIAGLGGGGIYAGSSLFTLCNNTICGNSAGNGYGGGVYFSGGNLTNNIISNNSSGIYDSGSVAITLKNNCVYNPSGANYTGVSAGATDISVDPGFLAPWVNNYRLRPDSPCVNTGDDASVTAGSLDLDGKTRIVGAHVDMGCYEWDGIGNIVNGLGEAKAIPENCPIQITGKPITGAFDGSFYIEEPNRSQGLKIIWPDAVAPGDTATVTGPVVLDNGERAMQATTVATTPGNADNIPPWLFVSGKYAGGGGYFWNYGGFACGQQGIFGSAGLNNVGLLVRVCGRFGYVDDSTFTVDDGSGTVLKCVVSGGVSLNADWRTVGVTGISSCEFVDGRLKPLLRVRSSGDIDVYSP